MQALLLLVLCALLGFPNSGLGDASVRLAARFQKHQRLPREASRKMSTGVHASDEPLCTQPVTFRLEGMASMTSGSMSSQALWSLLDTVDTDMYPHVRVLVQGLPCVELGCCEHRLVIRPKGSDVQVLNHAISEYTSFLAKLPGDVEFNNILDAGGNIGVATMVFAQLFPAANIVVLEPQAQNCLLAQANTLSLPNVRVFCNGLWVKETTVSVVHGGDSKDWAWRIAEVDASTPGAVKTTTVQSLLQTLKLDSFDFVKTDIEGAEFSVFGPDADLSWVKDTQLLACEIHGYLGNTTEVQERIKEKGFSTSTSGEYTVFARDDIHSKLV